MRQKLIALSALILISHNILARDTEKLTAYLKDHAVVLNFGSDSTLQVNPGVAELINKNMSGKKLLIMGEGGSHSLHLNGDIFMLVLKYAASHNLKYSFAEASRASAIRDQAFFETPGIDAKTFYKQYYPDDDRYFDRLKDAEKDAYNKCRYKLIGVDFERPRGLYMTLIKATQNVPASDAVKLNQLMPYLKDTSYLVDNARTFKKFYKVQQENFYRDSEQIKKIKGINYDDIKYELTNPNINTPTGARDRPMAENLLAEMEPVEGNNMYLLDCGMAHSRPNIKGTMANILSESDKLKDKITVVQIICNSCITPVEATSNWGYKYLDDSILSSFNEASGNNITLFDLSEISEEYADIKAYGSLLVFAHAYKN